MMGKEEDRIQNTGDRMKAEERWPKHLRFPPTLGAEAPYD